MSGASTTKTIPLNLNEHSHQINIAWGLRHNLADYLRPLNQGQQWLVLSQQAILDVYKPILDELSSAGFRLSVVVVPGDESAKDIRQAEKVWAQMVSAGCDRSSVLLALGGGVVGDLGGFVAATYMRGIPFVQIPTTLLAMIDSSIGGKTAVNLAAGKNLVGAIYQPKAVLVDPGFLQSLPKRNVISSLAEAVKYGFIRDPSIFSTFENKFSELETMSNPALLLEVIYKSCKIKAEIVSNDQFEGGERKLLNYGHTIGHAFETLHGHGRLYHGEAVLYGMRCANFISHKKGLLSLAEYSSAKKVLSQFDLPVMDEMSDEAILEVVSHDKKNINGKLSFILLDSIGNGVISTEVTPTDIVESLAEVA